MSTARVVALANTADLDSAENFLASAASPVMCECAVMLAAIVAGSAVSACAGYLANAWANLNGHGYVDDKTLSTDLNDDDNSAVNLIESRIESLR
jgi:hypothetical protein